MESVTNMYRLMSAIGVEVATEVVKCVSNDSECGASLLRMVLLLFFSFLAVIKYNDPKPA